MATWENLQAALRAQFQLDRDEASQLSLTLTFETEEGLRKQRVLLRQFIALDCRMVEIRSAFGLAKDQDPAALLVQNLSLPIGGIAIHGEVAVVVQKVPLEQASEEAILEMLMQVGFLADCLESEGGEDRY